MPFAPISDGELYYEAYGDGIPLLFVPGLGGVGAYWHPQIEHFARHRYRVITYDHRGCGRSTHSEMRYTVDGMCSDLLELMDHLALESVHLVGHSTGGAIGQTLAVTHRERLRSLVLYATWTQTDPFMRRVMETRKTLLESAGVEAYIRATPVFLYPDWWINSSAGELAALDAATLASFPAATIAASRCQAVIDFDRTAELGGITTPTQVICAKDDFLTPPYFSEDLARCIPGAGLVLLGRGGHAASRILPEPFNNAVLAFLRSLDES